MNLKLGFKKLGCSSSSKKVRFLKKPAKRKRKKANNTAKITKKAPLKPPESMLSRLVSLTKRKKMIVEAKTKTVQIRCYMT